MTPRLLAIVVLLSLWPSPPAFGASNAAAAPPLAASSRAELPYVIQNPATPRIKHFRYLWESEPRLRAWYYRLDSALTALDKWGGALPTALFGRIRDLPTPQLEALYCIFEDPGNRIAEPLLFRELERRASAEVTLVTATGAHPPTTIYLGYGEKAGWDWNGDIINCCADDTVHVGEFPHSLIRMKGGASLRVVISSAVDRSTLKFGYGATHEQGYRAVHAASIDGNGRLVLRPYPGETLLMATFKSRGALFARKYVWMLTTRDLDESRGEY